VSRFLLDTTFIIDHLRGEPEAVWRLRAIVESGDFAFVNDVVSAEAWAGAPSDDDHELTALLRFLEFIAAGPDHAKQAGRWRAIARSRGRELGIADALIASSADASRAIVLTRNTRDFALMPVAVEVY
jgi:predicted nucleic acid-binding protein